MPIRFPVQHGPTASYREQLWMKAAQKAFNVVPAPNIARPGFPFSETAQSGMPGWSLHPGMQLTTRRAVNLRNLKNPYVAPDQTSRVNPGNKIDETYDSYGSNDRILGDANLRIIGVSRDASGAPLGNCLIKVFKTSTDVLVAQATSDGSGNWTAYPNEVGPYYFVEYKQGSPDVFGTSPNTNTSTVFTPGA